MSNSVEVAQWTQFGAVVDVFVDLVQHQIEAGCFAVVACPFPEWRLERVVGDQQPTGEPPSSAGCR